MSAKLLSILIIGCREDVNSFLHKYIRETGLALRWPYFLTDQIRFNYFCKRSSSDLFYQIILNSEEKIFKGLITALSHALVGHVFDGSNFF